MGAYSTAYDAFRTVIAGLLPNHRELDNPYVVESSGDIELKKGFGITVGEAVNTTRVVSNRATIARRFGVVITRKIASVKNDVTARIAGEKLLFEDASLAIKYFEKTPTPAGITQARYESDEGITFLDSDRFNYLILKVAFIVEYTETF